MAIYLVSTRSYGVIQKSNDTIADARKWARLALGPAEVLGVQRSCKGTDVAALDQDLRAELARRTKAQAQGGDARGRV